MEKLSDYISKKIITIEEGSLVGYVLNVSIDETYSKVVSLVIVDEESEQIFLLDISKICAISEDCIMTRSKQDLSFSLQEDFNNPIGKIVLDKDGKTLGRVMDIYLDKFNIRAIVTDLCQFSPRYIYSSSDKYLIFGLRKKRKAMPIFKIENSEDLPKVSISDFPKNENTFAYSNPYKIMANQESLIGRKMTCDILGYNNELVAKKDEVISAKTINKAKKHNKISLLSYYSK